MDVDEKKTGDLIRGAWGTISHDHPQTGTIFQRIATLLVIMGPGIITMVGDNDAGAFATYTQAGQDYSNSLLWVLVLLIPILIINQEMVVRLGAVTRCGHARLIFARFGRFWGLFSVGNLLVLNFLTIITEFIGFAMGLSYFGMSPVLSVPIGIISLIVIALTGSFRRWESAMWICCLITSLTIPLVFFAHIQAYPILFGTVVPTVAGGINSTSMFVVIAIVGTTVAPWQLFFQQSNVIDKNLTTQWVAWERVDTYIGAYITNTMAAALVIAAAFLIYPTPHRFVSALNSAQVYALLGYPQIAGIFAILLINASVIGACTVSLSTSYAFGDALGLNTSLHSRFRDAKTFYGLYSGLIVIAGAVVLIPNAPLGLFTVAVQALAGVLLPSATVFLVLLCNDRAVLGPWCNNRGQNIAAVYVVGSLVFLSCILATMTLFPAINLFLFLPIFGAIFLIVIGAATVMIARSPRPGPSQEPREIFHMPPVEALSAPAPSWLRSAGLYTLEVYLVITVILLVVKSVTLMFH